MITIASLLWDHNAKSYHFSRCYDESWVIKLYNGFERNLNQPWRFVLFTERDRPLPEKIKQERIRSADLDYGACIEPYRFGVPMILVGLDTVIAGDVNHLADYCLTADKIALPMDPFDHGKACNGVALVPAGQQFIYRNWNGENDMQYMRQQPHVLIDDMFPGQVVSYKGHVKKHGLGDARIVYFHGLEKPHQLELEWIDRHWR